MSPQKPEIRIPGPDWSLAESSARTILKRMQYLLASGVSIEVLKVMVDRMLEALPKEE